MPKFTPGPWKKGKGGSVVAETNEHITIGGGYKDDAVKYYGGYLVGESISAGNIALIKIAPDMYELLWTIASKDEIWKVMIDNLLKLAEIKEATK